MKMSFMVLETWLSGFGGVVESFEKCVKGVRTNLHEPISFYALLYFCGSIILCMFFVQVGVFHCMFGVYCLRQLHSELQLTKLLKSLYKHY